MEVTRIFDLLPYQLENYNKTVAIGGKEDGKWLTYSTKEYFEASQNVSFGLLNLGVKKGDKIASITVNRPEWNIIDMGILQIGAVHVPIYPTISKADYIYILNHAEVKYVFVSGEDMYRKIKHIVPEIPTIQGVFTFKKKVDDVQRLVDLIEIGKQKPQAELLQQLKNGILPHDLATLIYTSGTTGNPKGVMLSHDNLISNFKAVAHIPPVKSEGIALSYLPTCHVYERMLNYMYQYDGISIYYVENIATISDNIKEIKPHILSTVPRLLEKIFDKMVATGRKMKGFKRIIYFWGIGTALKYNVDSKNSLWYKWQHFFLDKLVFKKWREALGGNFKVVVSGGAALQPRLKKFFWAINVPILEGYGLTETSPVIAVSHFDDKGVKLKSVGPVLGGVTVKIANDGEILCKGPNVMLGYYHAPELTKEVIDSEGWLHTGDLGMLDTDNHIYITGRKKELFKTSFGKYIAPQSIENKFLESSFIDIIMVLGENQKFAGALIVPNFEHLKSWCAIKEIPYTTDAEMIRLPRIKKRFQKEINKYNEFFGETEQVKCFELMESEWTWRTGELTPTLKLRRNYITKKYAGLIEKMFS